MLLIGDHCQMQARSYCLSLRSFIIFFIVETQIKIRPSWAKGQGRVEFLNLYLIAYYIVFGKLVHHSTSEQSNTLMII